MVEELDTESIEAATAALQSNANAAQLTASAHETLTNSVRIGTTAFGQLQERTAGATVNLSGVLQGIQGIVNTTADLDIFSRALNLGADALNRLGADGIAVSATLAGVLPVNTALFGEMGAAGKKAGFDIAEGFNRAVPILQKLPGIREAVPHFQRLFDTASQAQALELGLIRAATATGNLNKLTRELDGDFRNLENATARYTASINAVADASGVLPSQISPYANILANIPDALNTTISAQTNFTTELSMLNATFKVSTALGLDHTEMQKQLTDAWKTLDLRGQDALETIARIGLAAQDLNLPMDTVRERVFQTANAFKLWGDQTGAAIDVLSGVRGALEDSGIGPAAIDEVVGSMMQGIKNLDVAQKAFISGATGGPGGLFGAFDIDRMLREEGGAADVINKVMEAMQNQFGGPVVTHEDVMRTPALAGEFFKQITFLKDVAGIAGSDIEAQRILEVMKRGGVGAEELELARTPEDALRTAVETGTEIQQSQMNQVISLLANIEKAQSVAARKSLDIARFGQENLNAQQMLIDLNNETAKFTALGVKTTEDQRQVTAATEADALRTDVLPTVTNQLREITERTLGTTNVEGLKRAMVEGVQNMDMSQLLTTAREELGAGKTGEIIKDFKSLISKGLVPPSALQQTLKDELIRERTGRGLSQDISERLIGAPAELTAPGVRPRPIGLVPRVGEITRRGGVEERGVAAARAAAAQGMVVPEAAVSPEGRITVEVDIKDGVATIARTVVSEELKNIYGPLAHGAATTD